MKYLHQPTVYWETALGHEGRREGGNKRWGVKYLPVYAGFINEHLSVHSFPAGLARSMWRSVIFTLA